jgi:basic membrane lipoprotein Med (substrate-binding protein (PBP1-ABC) superfamily)
MKKSMRFVALVLSILLTFGLMAGVNAESDKKVKVALILEGAISDMSWNATATTASRRSKRSAPRSSTLRTRPLLPWQTRSAPSATKATMCLPCDQQLCRRRRRHAKEYPNTQFFFINSKVVDQLRVICHPGR